MTPNYLVVWVDDRAGSRAIYGARVERRHRRFPGPRRPASLRGRIP